MNPIDNPFLGLPSYQLIYQTSEQPINRFYIIASDTPKEKNPNWRVFSVKKDEAGGIKKIREIKATRLTDDKRAEPVANIAVIRTETRNKTDKDIAIHRLVSVAKAGREPLFYETSGHLDGDHHNLSIDNLKLQCPFEQLASEIKAGKCYGIWHAVKTIEDFHMLAKAYYVKSSL